MNLLTTLSRHWPIKLFSLAVGLLLWAHVKTEQQYERVISLPLTVIEASGRFAVANEIPHEVRVRVIGTGKDLLFRRPHARVVLRPRIRRRQAITLELTPENIEGLDEMGSIRVLDVESPHSVVLEFDYLDTREVTVISRVVVQPRAGYTVVGSPTVEPSTVRIGGPRKFVRQITSVTTDSVVLHDVAEPVSLEVPVRLPSRRNLAVTPEQVTVRADVQALLQRVLPNVPVRISHLPRDVRVRAEPEAVDVEVVGGERIVSALTPEECQVELDYRQRFEKGLNDLPLTVTLPPGVRLVRVSPPVASIILLRTSERR